MSQDQEEEYHVEKMDEKITLENKLIVNFQDLPILLNGMKYYNFIFLTISIIIVQIGIITAQTLLKLSTLSFDAGYNHRDCTIHNQNDSRDSGFDYLNPSCNNLTNGQFSTDLNLTFWNKYISDEFLIIMPQDQIHELEDLSIPSITFAMEINYVVKGEFVRTLGRDEKQKELASDQGQKIEGNRLIIHDIKELEINVHCYPDVRNVCFITGFPHQYAENIMFDHYYVQFKINNYDQITSNQTKLMFHMNLKQQNRIWTLISLIQNQLFMFIAVCACLVFSIQQEKYKDQIKRLNTKDNMSLDQNYIYYLMIILILFNNPLFIFDIFFKGLLTFIFESIGIVAELLQLQIFIQELQIASVNKKQSKTEFQIQQKEIIIAILFTIFLSSLFQYLDQFEVKNGINISDPTQFNTFMNKFAYFFLVMLISIIVYLSIILWQIGGIFVRVQCGLPNATNIIFIINLIVLFFLIISLSLKIEIHTLKFLTIDLEFDQLLINFHVMYLSVIQSPQYMDHSQNDEYKILNQLELENE